MYQDIYDTGSLGEESLTFLNGVKPPKVRGGALVVEPEELCRGLRILRQRRGAFGYWGNPEDLAREFEPSAQSIRQLGVAGGFGLGSSWRRADERGERGAWAATPWESASEAGAGDLGQEPRPGLLGRPARCRRVFEFVKRSDHGTQYTSTPSGKAVGNSACVPRWVRWSPATTTLCAKAS